MNTSQWFLATEGTWGLKETQPKRGVFFKNRIKWKGFINEGDLWGSGRTKGEFTKSGEDLMDMGGGGGVEPDQRPGSRNGHHGGKKKGV